MPPKTKAKTGPSPSDAPRRSGRSATVASTKAVVDKVASKVAKVTGQKRAAEGSAEEESKPKKARQAKEKAEEESESTREDTPALPLDPIDIGDPLPTLTLISDEGENIDVGQLCTREKKKGLVLFLIPKADTPGCTAQACSFNDAIPEFDDIRDGYDIMCLSAGSPAAHAKWKAKKNLKFTLLSDPKRQLINALGAGANGKTTRSVFIWDFRNKMVDKKIPARPADSMKWAYDRLDRYERQITPDC
ncbi:AhpC-TSA-domain-containing protein [Flagelloscypha sp. PMI_526]|nr:AhpC-TSA-domain-containing protein [Flagelloscypha sp. PMI_526]